MVRMIDAEKYMELLKEQYLHHKSMGNSQAARAWQGAMQLLYDMPTLTPPNEWVSVEERLPEHLKDVLALYGNGRIDIDWVDSSGDFKFGSLFDGVTHWMSLPAPPDEDNNVPTKEQNEPLTLDELLTMDGQPVYVVFRPDNSGDKPQFWALVSADKQHDEVYLLDSMGGTGSYDEIWANIEAIYRRPPEGEEE